MFDVFLNDLSHGQGVLLVHAEQIANNSAYEHIVSFNGNTLPLQGGIELPKLIQLLGFDILKLTSIPDSYPSLMPASSKTAVQLPRPMIDPDGDPPIKPK